MSAACRCDDWHLDSIKATKMTSMNSLLKVGLIGCGRIARLVHLNILLHLPGVELVALSEIDGPRRAEAHAVAPHAAVFADYREMLSMPQLDAVIICLPNALHAEAAVTASAQGKHIYIEKPLATNLQEGQNVLAEWRRSGKVGMIGFNYRFNSLYRSLRRQILSGRIGNTVAARSVFGTVRGKLEGWRHQRNEGGGVLLDLASHHIDLIRFLFGKEIVAVSASLRSVQSEDDTAVVHARLADGMFVESFFSLDTLEEDCFEIYGEIGKLAVDRYRSHEVEYTTASRGADRFAQLGSSARFISHLPFLFEKLRAPGNEPSYRAALTQFVLAARTGKAVSPDLEDGYRSLAVVLSAEEAASANKLVAVMPGVGPV
jgi:myo-inositol 2-dehydrogenase / D-chiro-inositol 1-dehydrogenase